MVAVVSTENGLLLNLLHTRPATRVRGNLSYCAGAIRRRQAACSSPMHPSMRSKCSMCPDVARGPHMSDNVFYGPLGFIPTDWYPSALAVQGDNLLIATAKGQGTGPNKGMGKTAYEIRHQGHPYIPTLLRGSIARLNIPSTLGKLEATHAQSSSTTTCCTTIRARSNSPAARIRSSTSSTSSRKTAPMTRYSAT